MKRKKNPFRRVPTSGDDTLFRKFSSDPGDQQALYDVQTLAIRMTLEELKRFCEGSMNALVVVQDQFRKRFPDEYAEWVAQIDADSSKPT